MSVHGVKPEALISDFIDSAQNSWRLEISQYRFVGLLRGASWLCDSSLSDDCRKVPNFVGRLPGFRWSVCATVCFLGAIWSMYGKL